MMHDRMVCYSDPHPGNLGCPIELPKIVRLVIHAMDGHRGHLTDGLLLIILATNGLGSVTVHETSRFGDKHRSINYKICYPNGPREGHIDCWRLLSFYYLDDEE